MWRGGRAATLIGAMLLAFACTTSGQAPPTAVQSPSLTSVVVTAAAPVSATPIPAQPVPVTATASPSAAAFPDPESYVWAPVVSGLQSPVDIQFPDDGTRRMFVLEQVGRIRIVENGQLVQEPYLDISNRVGSGGDEQGLLGLAFHPDFKDNPYFYINYTDLNGNTVIARFKAQGDSADPASETDLMHVPQPFPNHNGGGLVFGPDGFLYMGLGDGGSQGDPNGNGQNTHVLLGKILRIDVDHGDPYAIPAGNPFVNSGGRPEIWAYGLRNPWRFSFAQGTNELYIADVGQDLWEEVDVALGNPAGLNYGWNYYEGRHPYSGQPPPNLKVTMPVTEYSHAEGGCAIIGGYVYAGKLDAWRGIYLYGDDCSGLVWGLLNTSNPPTPDGWQSQLLFRTGQAITTFGQDPSGEVYLAGRGGTVFRLQMRP